METFLESDWLRVNTVQKRGHLMQKQEYANVSENGAM